MLRVSSLGLKRYHDASSSLLLQCRKSAYRLASHEVSERGETAHAETHQEANTSSQPLDRPSNDHSGENAGAGTSNTTGFHAPRRPTVIPPLCIRPKKTTPTARVSQKSAGSRGGVNETHEQHRPPLCESITDIAVGEVSSLVQQDAASHGTPSDEDPALLADNHDPQNRAHLENIMATTASAEEAWDAYQALVALPRPVRHPPVPFAHLHRLTRLLASTHPRTRTLLLRLLSVLSTIHVSGGYVRVWQWNALIDCAGKGWRKTRLEDFKAALDVYQDMIFQRQPGASFGHSEASLAMEGEVFEDVFREDVRPDIITFTTLLNIAGRTLQENALRRALSMLESSGLQPNRITYLSLIRYHTRKNQLSAVRTILARMRDLGFELGTDGLNACIWAYSRNGRLDVATNIYRLLRHRVMPESLGQDDADAMSKHLYATEGLSVPETILPDAATYYTLIQGYAYHGDLIQCLQVFMDMVTISSRSSLTDGTEETDISSPTLPAFRAIFLGFARHGTTPLPMKNLGPLSRRLTTSAWNADNLHLLFQSFLKLPHDVKPSERTIFWVLMAFANVCDHDSQKLRRVWKQLEERFGGGWGGRLERLRQRIYEDQKK